MATTEQTYLQQYRQQYQENSIVSSKSEDLTLMLYNGLIKFIARAQDEIRAKNYEAAHNTLIRCQDIVFEFQFTLNMEYEMSDNLMRLYDFMYNRLIEANAKKDCSILDEVQEFATDMRDTWLEAMRQTREHKAADDAENGAPKAQPAPKKITYTNKAPAQPAAAPAQPAAAPAALAQPTAVPAAPVAATASGEAETAEIAPPPVAVFSQAMQATRLFTNPLNKINPGIAAQYAKVHKSKELAQESISIASK